MREPRVTADELRGRGPSRSRLVAEIHRLRGIILSSARQVEGDPAHGVEDLSAYFDVLMEEAKEIREEIRRESARS